MNIYRVNGAGSSFFFEELSNLNWRLFKQVLSACAQLLAANQQIVLIMCKHRAHCLQMAA